MEDHGVVIWSSGDTGASVPERKTKNCLFEDTKARRGVYQVGGREGESQGMCGKCHLLTGPGQ